MRRSREREPLEGGRVHVDGGWLQRQAVALLPECAVGIAQRLANEEQGLPEARPGRLLPAPAPEERGQRVARMRPAERQGEIGDEGLGLAGGQREGWARVETGLEAAEERETEPRHGVLG